MLLLPGGVLFAATYAYLAAFSWFAGSSAMVLTSAGSQFLAIPFSCRRYMLLFVSQQDVYCEVLVVVTTSFCDEPMLESSSANTVQ